MGARNTSLPADTRSDGSPQGVAVGLIVRVREALPCRLQWRQEVRRAQVLQTRVVVVVLVVSRDSDVGTVEGSDRAAVLLGNDAV